MLILSGIVIVVGLLILINGSIWLFKEWGKRKTPLLLVFLGFVIVVVGSTLLTKKLNDNLIAKNASVESASISKVSKNSNPTGNTSNKNIPSIDTTTTMVAPPKEVINPTPTQPQQESSNGQAWDFENPIDSFDWKADWDSGTSRGILSLTITSTQSYTGKSSMVLYINKTDAKDPDGVTVSTRNFRKNMASDTVVSFYIRSLMPIKSTWFETKAFSIAGKNYAWDNNGVYGQLSPKWTQYINYRSDKQTPYDKIGFQIWTGTDTGTFIVFVDNGYFGSDPNAVK